MDLEVQLMMRTTKLSNMEQCLEFRRLTEQEQELSNKMVVQAKILTAVTHMLFSAKTGQSSVLYGEESAQTKLSLTLANSFLTSLL